MKIVSVMTGAAPGGAEFAAVELLDALVGRGHEAVMLSDWPEIGRDTRVEVRPLAIGPKLSARSWPSLMLRWPVLRRRLRQALEGERPYDVLLLHFKKEQLLAPRCRPIFVPGSHGPSGDRCRASSVRAWGAAVRRGRARRIWCWRSPRGRVTR